MTMTEIALPRWDLTTIFPALDSPEFQTAFETIRADIAALQTLFDTHGIRRRDNPSVEAAFVQVYDDVTHRLNDLLMRVRVLGAYIACHVTTDARDTTAQALESRYDIETVPLNLLYTRYIAWVGTSDLEALLSASETARNYRYALEKARTLAKHQMSEAEEALASELRSSSINAWSNLHGSLTALLSVPVEIEGETKSLPMSAVRALANHADGAVRKAAYEAEIKAWEETAVPLAAAMNGVKGYQNILRRKRGYADDIVPTLLTNSMDAETLNAMQTACVEAFPDFRRYLDAKARFLGKETMTWHDLNAPVGSAGKKYTWEEATAFVISNFRCYSDRLADFAAHTFEARWIDAEPRIGKQGGAYCTGERNGQSRIFMNFDGSYNSVSTLAHELGHAYHNLNLKERTYFQRSTPMTLAETASIFCETLMADAAMQDTDRDTQIALLDITLQRNLQTVVDIHSRFLFEKAVFERRQARELSVAEFNELMLDAQRQTYGTNVTPLHPYMWAVKGHYYGPTFYNYPYTFGLLFGLGLYAQYRHEPEAFRTQYDTFLSSTGLADAATLTREFGIDIRDVAFWRSSLDVIRAEIAQFSGLVEG